MYTGNQRHRLRPTVMAAAVAAVVVLGAAAQEVPAVLDYSLGFRAGWHSNITRTSGEDVSESVLAPFARFAIDREGRNVRFAIEGDVEHAIYLNDKFDDQFRGDLLASARYRSRDDRFHWEATDAMRTAPRDPLATDRPDNEQLTNYFTTGPDLRLRLSPVDRVIFGARYGHFYEEEGDDDNERLGLAAAWRHRFGPASSTGLSLEASTVEFDSNEGRGSDYDRRDVAWEYLLERRASDVVNNVTAAVGYSQLEFDDPALTDLDSPLYRLAWVRNQPGRQRMSIRLRREISDIARELGSLTVDRMLETRLAVASSRDPFERSRVDARLDRGWERFGAGVSAFYDTLDYANEPLDQDYWGVGGRVSYRMSPLMTLGASAAWTDRDFTQIGQQDETLRLGLDMNYQHTRHWASGVELGWYDRDSTTDRFNTDDLAAMVRVTWTR